jgi:hypothetical protein
VSYVDLALDLWVAADGAQTVLDEAEFDALPLEAATQLTARQSLRDLQLLFSEFLAGRAPGEHFHEYLAAQRS